MGRRAHLELEASGMMASKRRWVRPGTAGHAVVDRRATIHVVLHDELPETAEGGSRIRYIALGP